MIHQLQQAVATDSYAAYQRFVEMIEAQDPVAIRDLLDFRRGPEPVPIDEVESITEIRKRFVTPGMSLGASAPRRTRRCPSP
jgi:glutamate synthase (NADPH) large chain